MDLIIKQTLDKNNRALCYFPENELKKKKRTPFTRKIVNQKQSKPKGNPLFEREKNKNPTRVETARNLGLNLCQRYIQNYNKCTNKNNTL